MVLICVLLHRPKRSEPQTINLECRTVRILHLYGYFGRICAYDAKFGATDIPFHIPIPVSLRRKPGLMRDRHTPVDDTCQAKSC